MPISDSTSEKHLSTRTAATTEDKREPLDEVDSMVGMLQKMRWANPTSFPSIQNSVPYKRKVKPFDVNLRV
jgi:hypothetical protein